MAERRPDSRKAEAGAGRAPASSDPSQVPHAADPAEPAGEGDPGTEREHAEAADRAGAADAYDGAPAAEPEEDPLARAERERAEYLELAQRTQADFENYRKRAARDAAQAGERAKAGLVRELLSVVDNLERALGAPDEGLREGVQLVHSELLGVLSRSGIEAFDPKGEPFDPTVHEALSTREQQDAQPGVVLDVVEKGYRMDATVLRPARVVVSG